MNDEIPVEKVPPGQQLWPHYTSTYCMHGLHHWCRVSCKVCQAHCLCHCHLVPPELAFGG